MKVLVTAGSTEVEIDQVRVISNKFKGKTGAIIAEAYKEAGHDVSLITSSPKSVQSDHRVIAYRTYDELRVAMEEEIKSGEYDIIIHSAAVSDYKAAGVFKKLNGDLQELDSSKKTSSKHDELFIRLTPTDKIVRKIKDDWEFNGQLVMFKLEVGTSDIELINIARNSLAVSKADLIVANCLEWARDCAYIVSKDKATLVKRSNLAPVLIEITTKH